MPFLNKEDEKEYRKKYWEENKEDLILYHKEKRNNRTEEEKEEHRIKRRIWREKNKEDINKKRRERKQTNKQYLVDMLGGKCVGCGTTECLQFDHIDRHKKSFCISTKLAHQLDKLIEEANKCQLLCEKCHQIKTSINHDANLLAEGKRVTNIQKIGNKTIVTLEELAQ